MLATDEDLNCKIVVKIFVYINRCIITGKQLFNIYKDIIIQNYNYYRV